MATPLPIKRMSRERVELEKDNSDYFVHFGDDNLLKFEAYIVGPDDTLYQHKFVKLRFEIPDRYPMVPPKVTFIQHSGQRIHPNLYVEGKVCLSILGTWPGEPWAFGMNCNTVLITIRSLLDNQPYRHEPGNRDNPAFNKFVQYSTWRCLLLDYIRNETAEPAKAFLQKHLRERGPQMIDELRRQQTENSGVMRLTSPYTYGSCGSGVDYTGLIRDLVASIPAAAQESSGGIKRPLEALEPSADIHHGPLDDLDHRQHKRIKKDRSIQVIDLTEDTSDSEPHSSTAKNVVGTTKADSTAYKRAMRQ